MHIVKTGGTMGEYIENMKDALPDPARVKAIKKDLESKGVKYIYSHRYETHTFLIINNNYP